MNMLNRVGISPKMEIELQRESMKVHLLGSEEGCRYHVHGPATYMCWGNIFKRLKYILSSTS